MKSPVICAALLIGSFFSAACEAEQGGRPDNLTLEDFQFGPANRWTFSHMREVLPTANIPRDPERMLRLGKSGDFVSDFAVEFQGRRLSPGR